MKVIRKEGKVRPKYPSWLNLSVNLAEILLLALDGLLMVLMLVRKKQFRLPKEIRDQETW